jgi:RNA polymerase sigma-70 factor, ECF subfamily
MLPKTEVRPHAGAYIEVLYQEYQRPLLAYLTRLVSDREAAEDLCQETFIKAMRGWEQRDTAASVTAWLYRIATNTAYDYLRQQRRAAAVMIGHNQDSLALAAPSTLDTRMAESAVIHGTLRQIPMHYRLPLLLHACSGYDLKTIAVALGCNVNTIKTRVYRARERFRQAYVV